MTRLLLRALWNARPAPQGLGGHARLTAHEDRVRFEWELDLPDAPRVPDAAPGFLDGLWEHDVVELFVTGDAIETPRPRYLEVEIGPGAHWLALSFDGVRERSGELRDLDPAIASSVAGRRWTGSVSFALAAAEAVAGARPWRGIACLACGPPGARVYLSSAPLPGTAADFHQPSVWPLITAGRAGGRG